MVEAIKLELHLVSEDDAAEYRRRISEILASRDFAWVVVQAEAEISAGKSVTKEVTETELLLSTEETGFAPPRTRKRRSRLLSSQPYTEAEKLDILLRGFEAAVIERAELEREILTRLDGVKGLDGVEFIPDLPAADADRVGEVRHRLDGSTRAEKDALAARAKELFARFRGSLNERS